MNLLKLLTVILIFCSGFTYAQSDLDRYYSLEKEVAQLRAQFRDNQGLILETNTTLNHFWSPSSTKKILDRLHKDQDRILKEMEPKIKEMRRLEQILEVKAWDYRFGVLEQVNTILGNVAQSNTCSAQGQQLFTSDKAFEAWNTQNGDLDRKVAYYAQKNGYISNCLEDKNEGDKASVNESWKGLCKIIDWWPDKYQSGGTPSKYRVYKKNQIINIDTSISFSYQGDKENKSRSFERVKKAIPCMKNFYARHGIKLNLRIETSNNPHSSSSCDHSINLWDEKMNPDADNWTTTTYLDDSQVCRHFLHELGHKLRLDDSYPDPGCPDRKPIKSRYDIMYAIGMGAADVTESRLDADSISKIIGPFCRE